MVKRRHCGLITATSSYNKCTGFRASIQSVRVIGYKPAVTMIDPSSQPIRGQTNRVQGKSGDEVRVETDAATINVSEIDLVGVWGFDSLHSP